VDEPLAELAAYFRRRTGLPNQELIQLTTAARITGSRWHAVAVAAVYDLYDLAGVIRWGTAGGAFATPARHQAGPIRDALPSISD
jgi:hypothetical protein